MLSDIDHMHIQSIARFGAYPGARREQETFSRRTAAVLDGRIQVLVQYVPVLKTIQNRSANHMVKTGQRPVSMQLH
jgi:hypothetical protein